MTEMNFGQTAADAATAAAQLLRQAKMETPELDARVLLCHAAGLTHEDLLRDGDLALSREAADRFKAYIGRRLAGEPVSRILGVREFYGRDFRIDKNTLDPRPDTETLIEAALDLVDREGWRQRSINILDLGTGSGAILVTLLAELPEAHGVGTDISLAGLQTAKANATALGVGTRASFVAAHWLDGIAGSFDLVVSNPPYIASGAIAALAPEVRLHDPKLALDGGADGLSAYRAIAPSARRVLRPYGSLLVEIGPEQADAVRSLVSEAGFRLDVSESLWRDLAGRKRVVVSRA